MGHIYTKIFFLSETQIKDKYTCYVYSFFALLCVLQESSKESQKEDTIISISCTFLLLIDFNQWKHRENRQQEKEARFFSLPLSCLNETSLLVEAFLYNYGSCLTVPPTWL